MRDRVDTPRSAPSYFFLSAVFGCLGFLGVFAFLSIWEPPALAASGSSPGGRP